MLLMLLIFPLGRGKCNYYNFQLHLGHSVPISIECKCQCPCFYWTDLVSVDRVYPSCFHNTVVSPCYRLDIPFCMLQVLLLVSV